MGVHPTLIYGYADKFDRCQYSGICKSGFIKGISVIIIFGVIKIILVRGFTECTNNAANFEF